MNRSINFGIIVFITVLLLTQYLAFQQFRISKAEESQSLADELNAVSERLKETLSYSLSATNTLAFIVEQYGVPQNFDDLARKIISSYDHIDALELTQKGIITHVYPLEGNEKAVGLDILNHAPASAEAKKAIERGNLFFAGPLELVQGGLAVVGRLPIYIENEFFGFSVTVIRLQTLVKALGVISADKEFNYQLSKINPITEKEEFFLSDVIDKGNESVMSVEIADGEWILYVSPRFPHLVYQQAFGFSFLGLILSVISGLFFYQWSRQPERLNKLVEQKTSELQHEKNLSDSIINSLPGVFYLFDRNGKFLRWNKYLETISGFSEEELKEKRPDDFRGLDTNQVLNTIKTIFEKGEDEMETNLIMRNGKRIPYYLYGRKIKLDQREYLIGMGIDISERKRAQEKALAASREKEVTLNRISDGVISLDKDWKYLFVNDAALNFFRDKRAEILGKHILEIEPQVGETSFWRNSQKAFENGTNKEFSIYYEPLDKWFSVKIYPSEDGITVFFKDITSEKKIEQETMKLIGRELHDNVVQVLTGAGLFLNIGLKKLGDTNNDLDKVGELIKKSIEEIRMLSHDLISPFMQGETLEKSVREVFTHASRTAGFKVQFDFSDFREEFLSDKLKTSTFRIIQEQCNNILKYAEPKKVFIKLAMDEDQFYFVISDDGVGFDPAINTGGIGFINIRSRIALFSGEFSIDSSPGKGCEIRVSFPLPEKLVVRN
tara:strand:- start:92741 stop:94912 length:2172 start_codon:yes stop_codon:yes gene_type:complete